MKVVKGYHKHDSEGLGFVAAVLPNQGQTDDDAIDEAYRNDAFLIPFNGYPGQFFAKKLRVRWRTKRKILVYQEFGWDV